MIEVTCRTNLDVREQWPNWLPVRPMVGDIVTSKNGLELQVCQVKFAYQQMDEVSEALHVELHLPPHQYDSIKHFNIWYEEFFVRKDKESYRRRTEAYWESKRGEK